MILGRIQNRACNELVDYHMNAFQTMFSKTKIQCLSNELFLLLERNLVFRHSFNKEMSLQEEENKRLCCKKILIN